MSDGAILGIVLFITLGFIMVFYFIGYSDGTDAGRFDVVKGRVKMRLVEFKDNTREWYAEDEFKELKGEFTVIKEFNC